MTTTVGYSCGEELSCAINSLDPFVLTRKIFYLGQLKAERHRTGQRVHSIGNISIDTSSNAKLYESNLLTL